VKKLRSWAVGVLALIVIALALAPVSSADNGFTSTATATGVTLGGDVTGPAGANSAVRINGSTVVAGGALTTGNVLQVNGASSTTYAPLNVGGGANFVTGSLPAANQVAQTLGGDATGTTAAVVNGKVNGTTYPAGGALTTGNVAQVSGASSIIYGALNLGGGAGYVTGSLPDGNQAAQTCTGDVTGNTGATVVSAISGSTPVAITPNELQWKSTATPLIDQASTASTPAANSTWAPQRSTTATNRTDGNAIISLGGSLGSGTVSQVQVTSAGSQLAAIYPIAVGSTRGCFSLGTTAGWCSFSSDGTTFNIIDAPGAGGTLFLRVNASNILELTSADAAFLQPVSGLSGGNAFSWKAVTVALTSGASNVLTNAQYYAPHLKFTGTLTGAGTTVTFPSTDGACWDLDFSAIVTITDSIALIANGNTWSIAVASVGTEYPHVCYSAGAGRLVGNSMVQ
jgi:hypothetical protein